MVDDLASYDSGHNVVLLVSTPRRDADGGTVLLNGTNAPQPLEMRLVKLPSAIVNIHTFRRA